jgi:hypothetical protein
MDWLPNRVRFWRWISHATAFNCCADRANHRRCTRWDCAHYVHADLRGALFVSVGKNVFTNQLLSELLQEAKGFDANVILKLGATTLKTAVPPEYLPGVLVTCNRALTETWYVSVAMSCLTGIGAATLEWKSVKGRKIEMGVGA